MEVVKLVVGVFEENCFLLIKDGFIAVIDPGASYRKITAKIQEYENHQVCGILLTHGHFDHIGAVDKLVKEYHCPVYACKDDERLLIDPEVNSLAGYWDVVHSKVTWIEDTTLKVGPFDFQVIFTPGHTAGSVVFVIEDKVFSGDTLFYMSVGRTDLYSGSFNQLKQSLEKLKKLNPDYVVYSGHGPETTIGFELEHNYYMI